MQIKTTMTFYYTSIGMAKNKKEKISSYGGKLERLIFIYF